MSLALTEIGGGLQIYVRIESDDKVEKNGRPGAVYANCTPWHIQTIWADVVGVGEVPPDFVNTCSDRNGAREGEEEERNGSSHCRYGRREKSAKRAAWCHLFITRVHVPC